MDEKFCENCKVSVSSCNSHCPLCGCFLGEAEINENKRHFPKYKPVVDKNDPVTLILIKMALLSMALCMGLDLLLKGSITFSLYAVVGIVYCIFVVLFPIRYKYSLAQILNTIAYFTMGLILFCELITNTWGWGICIAVPGVWLAIVLTSGVCTLSFGYVNYAMFKPIIAICFLSIVSLIFIMCFGQLVWPTIVVFLVSITEVLLMFMFRFKRSIRSLKKEFRF